ncbi:MAG: PP2C family protein-serine/threonine phosphatase [Marinilabiliaceae bacterium]
MRRLRSLLFCVVALLVALTPRTPVIAQNEAANAYIAQFADSALIDILNCESSKAAKWADAMMTIAADSDMVCIAQCLKSCVSAANGKTSEVGSISNSVRHFAYRRDDTAQLGLALSYCSLGYFDFENSTSPNDFYFKKAEMLAKNMGNKRLEAMSLAFRTQLYIRSMRFVEASYCARSLLTMCNGVHFPDLQLAARLFLLRIYSAVRMESAVSLAADAIEVHPMFNSDPIYAAAFSKAMAIDRIRSGNFGEANVYSWGAFRVGNRYSLAHCERWSRAFIRAVSLFNTGHIAEAQALVDSCRKYSYVVASHPFAPFESEYSLALLQAQIEQARGYTSVAKNYLDSANIPPQLMAADDFVGPYYHLVEQNAVARGDYKTARRAVLKSDSISRRVQLVNTRILCKDMWISTQDDSLIVAKRRTVQSDEVKVEGRRREVYGFVIVSVAIALTLVGYGYVILRRKEKIAWQAGVKYNMQLVSEINDSTRLIEEQNALISKRNFDMAASRTYAKRMQRGIWPNPSKLTSLGMPCSFILRGTTESISSCFYWYRRVGDSVIVCCADSGMGDSVAGAMLSIVGLTIFNDSASKLGESKSAAELLRIVDSNFESCLPDDDWRGGISMSVAVVDTRERIVNVAAASADALVFNKGKVSTITDSFEKVGSFEKSGFPLKDYTFSYGKGDSIFLFTKSFVDMTNVAGEALGIDRLKLIIQRSIKLPQSLYHDAILNELMYWRSSRPFTQDILLVGFTLP